MAALVAQRGLDRRGLVAVVHRRRGAVGVDVVDVGRLPAGVAQREPDRARRALARGRGDVVGVGGGGVAGQPAEDRRAAPSRHRLGLEQQHARALAEDEAVAALVERARDAERGGRPHAVEAGARERRHPGVGTAHEAGVGVAVAHEPVARADRVRAGRARRDGAVALALEAELHRQHAGGGVGHEQRDRERRERPGAALQQRAVLVLDRPEPAEAGPDDAADPLVVGGQLCVPSRLRGGLAAGHQRELGEAVGAAPFLAGQ